MTDIAGLELRECCMCGIPFLKNVKERVFRFCSSECYSSFRKVELRCEVCQKILGRSKRFCSKICRGKSDDFSLRLHHCETPWNLGKNGYTTRISENKEEYAALCFARSYCRQMLKRTLLIIKKKKNGKRTKDILGYTHKEFKEHIEKLFQEGMSWSNHGSGVGMWNVDHIRPICTWSKEELVPSVVNALKNLRPLWWEENMRRKRRGNVDGK